MVLDVMQTIIVSLKSNTPNYIFPKYCTFNFLSKMEHFLINKTTFFS